MFPFQEEKYTHISIYIAKWFNHFLPIKMINKYRSIFGTFPPIFNFIKLKTMYD